MMAMPDCFDSLLIYCPTLGGLKPPALAGSFSISSLPLAVQNALDIPSQGSPLAEE